MPDYAINIIIRETWQLFLTLIFLGVIFLCVNKIKYAPNKIKRLIHNPNPILAALFTFIIVVIAWNIGTIIYFERFAIFIFHFMFGLKGAQVITNPVYIYLDYYLGTILLNIFSIIIFSILYFRSNNTSMKFSYMFWFSICFSFWASIIWYRHDLMLIFSYYHNILAVTHTNYKMSYYFMMETFIAKPFYAFLALCIANNVRDNICRK